VKGHWKECCVQMNMDSCKYRHNATVRNVRILARSHYEILCFIRILINL